MNDADFRTNNDPNRVQFNDDGTLDEVCSTRGAHLEHMSSNNWFLIFQHEDGTESAFWFKSKDLKKPFWETREPRPAIRQDSPNEQDERYRALAEMAEDAKKLGLE